MNMLIRINGEERYIINGEDGIGFVNLNIIIYGNYSEHENVK